MSTDVAWNGPSFFRPFGRLHTRNNNEIQARILHHSPAPIVQIEHPIVKKKE
jgi:hypothetical protein